MSDQELRDKLASEARPLGKLLSPYEQDLWCNGWDSAKANNLRNHKWDTSEYIKLSSYEQERDQLRAEIQRLNEVVRDVRQLEGKALAQCEKLAEALTQCKDCKKLEELANRATTAGEKILEERDKLKNENEFLKKEIERLKDAAETMTALYMQS